MWHRSDSEDGHASNKTDDSSSSTTPLSFQPLTPHYLGLDDNVSPTVNARSSPSSSPHTSFRIPASPSTTSCWSRSCQLLMGTMSLEAAPSCLDVTQHNQPMRKCSSLTKLSSGSDESSRRTSGYHYNPVSQGSLDRDLLYGHRKKPIGAGPCNRYNHSSRFSGLETDLPLSSPLSSPVKHNSLDMNYHALPEAELAREHGQVYSLSLPRQVDSLLGNQTDRSSQIQTSVHRQVWLTEQMEYRPKAMHGGKPGQMNTCTETETCGTDGLSPWQQRHQQGPGFKKTVIGTSLPVNTLVKVKERLLRQREVEIYRQKQQILQLHARIRENELRAQQVLKNKKGWPDDPHILNTQESATRTPSKQHSDEGLGRTLAVAELKVLHLNEFYKQVTQKYTEDIRKLKEKIKTRDCYISSLKKKCQRESQQNQDKQQRIEILEKYLSDLPTLDEAQAQSQQQEEVQTKAEELEKTMSCLQRSLEEGWALIKEKNIKIEMQAKREKEMMASVHSLQKKVQHCLDDGLRLPMQDLMQLEVEHAQLLVQQDHNSRLIEHQKEQIERLTSQLTATSKRLMKKRDPPNRQRKNPLYKEDSLASTHRVSPQQHQVDEGLVMHPLSRVEITEVGRVLREMSLCLLDLQALCSILAQTAQGKEPNLCLLLGMKSLSVSAVESDSRVVLEEELRFKLLEVSQMRRDIDELWTSISDRYGRYIDNSCVSQ